VTTINSSLQPESTYELQRSAMSKSNPKTNALEDHLRPAKRPRLTSTPSSSRSSSSLRTSKSSTPPTDIDSARKASAQRVLNVWSQLAERYNKRLDEDDIIDLYSGAIIKDRGVLSRSGKDYNIGHFAGDDVDADAHDDSEEEPDEDEEADELDMLPRRQPDTEQDFKSLLRGVPPLSASADASDLEEFMEAEKRMREIDEDEEEEDLLDLHSLHKIRKSPKRETVKPGREETIEEEEDTGEDQESRIESSEDELAVWDNDESTPVHPTHQSRAAFPDTKQPEIIELTDSDSDSDSDREFSLLLQRPSRKRTRSVSPSPRPLIPHHYPSPFPSIPHSRLDNYNYEVLSPPPPPPPQIPFDPVRAQQAQYLLAQAMHQLSYLMSSALPACSLYPTPPQSSSVSSSSVPPKCDSSPSVSHSRAPHARSMLPPTRLSLSSLPPSSPTLSTSSSLSMHPPDERRAPSRARNQTSPRKVSFKIEKATPRSNIYRK